MQDKPVALVTGANQGIGFQIAKDLAAKGFTVLLGARNIERGEAAANAIGPDAVALQLDVTDQASITAAAERVRKEFGRLDVLIQNAAISTTSVHAQTPEEHRKANRPSVVSLDEMRAVWDTNVFGVLSVYQAMLPILRDTPNSRIVNVSSGAGSLTLASEPNSPLHSGFDTTYAASKTALNAITVAMAIELEADGIVLAVGMLLLPETPRWLAGHGHTDRARAALLRLRGHGVDIQAEMAQLHDDLNAKAQARPENKLGHASARMPMIVGIGLAVFQQVTGINTVIYFAPTIFQASGLSSASAAILATAGIGVVNVLMTMVAIWLIDRVGRRALLLLCGLGGMGISLCLLAAGFMLGSGPALGYLTAASLTAYIGCFAIGLGPVFWLLISEIFPMAIRARGMSAATIAN